MDRNQLIVDYLNNNLSNKDQKIFDDLLASDVTFTKEIDFQKNLKTVIAKEDYISLKLHLQSLEKQKQSFNYKKWIVAASIIIMIGFSSLLYINYSTPQSEDLYAQNFVPYKNIVKPIVRGEIGNDIESNAFAAYESKNYNKALAYFNTLLESKSDHAIMFYKAITLLELNKTEESISILRKIIEIDTIWKDKGLWYLSLAYLKIDDVSNAKKYLEALTSNATENSFNKEKAKKLFNQLK